MQKLIFIYSFIIIFLINIFPQVSHNVTLLGRWPDGPCEAISLKDNIAFIGNGSSIEAVDVTNTTSPALLSKLDCNGFIWDIFIYENIAFMGTSNGIFIVNISEPENLMFISELKTSNEVTQVFYRSGELFFTEDNTLKMTQYTYSKLVDEYVIFSSAHITSFSIKDTLAFVNDWNEGLYIINFSNLLNPEFVSLYQVPPGHYHNQVYVQNEMAYISTEVYYSRSKIQLLDVSDPYSPNELGFLNCRGDMWSEARSVSIFDTLIFATYRSDIGDGFIIGSIHNLSAPYILNDIVTDLPDEITIKQNKIYISADYQGMQIYDVSDYNSVTLLSEYYTRGITYDIFAKNDLAFIANDRAGLRILDFSDYSEILEVGFFDFDTTFSATVRSVFVQDNLAYLTSRGYSAGLKIVDITDPHNPYELGYERITYGLSITLKDNFAFIADDIFGMNIFDVNDSTNPVKIWQKTNGNSGTDIYLQDTLCFLASGIDGFFIYDIRNPFSPEIISNIQSMGYASGIYSENEILYLADHEAGLRIYNVSDPYNPIHKTTYDVDSKVLKVSVFSQYAYIADKDKGLEVLDVSDLNNITLKGYYRSHSVKNIYLIDSLIFLSEGRSGVTVLRNDLITGSEEEFTVYLQEFTLFQNYPNPFNPSTKIKFTIPAVEAGHAPSVQLKVYDVLGNKIATLVNEEKPAGSYEVEFSTGLIHQTLPSGIYFYQLRADDYVETKKMILLR